jgi:hypothetical protein
LSNKARRKEIEMAGEALHERAMAIIRLAGKSETFTTEDYLVAADRAKAEGVEYESEARVATVRELSPVAVAAAVAEHAEAVRVVLAKEGLTPEAASDDEYVAAAEQVEMQENVARASVAEHSYRVHALDVNRAAA